MDQAEYNKQAVDWRTIKPRDELITLSYGVPHTDVIHFANDAIQDPDPWYLEDSPFGGPIVPPGYFFGEYIRLVVIPNFPMGALNSKISAQSKGPIFHGEQITVTGIVDCIYEKRGRPYMDVVVVIRKEDGYEAGRIVVSLLLELEEKTQ
jgi:hypothetical protein